MIPTDEQRDMVWQDRYTRLAIEADGRWSDEDFAALAALGAERDAERAARICRARSATVAFRRIIIDAEGEA